MVKATRSGIFSPETGQSPFWKDTNSGDCSTVKLSPWTAVGKERELLILVKRGKLRTTVQTHPRGKHFLNLTDLQKKLRVHNFSVWNSQMIEPLKLLTKGTKSSVKYISRTFPLSMLYHWWMWILHFHSTSPVLYSSLWSEYYWLLYRKSWMTERWSRYRVVSLFIYIIFNRNLAPL